MFANSPNSSLAKVNFFILCKHSTSSCCSLCFYRPKMCTRRKEEREREKKQSGGRRRLRVESISFVCSAAAAAHERAARAHTTEAPPSSRLDVAAFLFSLSFCELDPQTLYTDIVVAYTRTAVYRVSRNFYITDRR